ncbi:MAG TPA: patatin-like phospholipase family protein, partial [Dehalococcoidia bacterium]|nr:patatin-like phospholipase family protein [Dehalococcoidia bacterium]
MTEPELALVLGGGGNLGVVQVAFIEALAERGVTPDLIVGTSVGALNASFLAFGDRGAEGSLDEAWLSLRGQRLFHRNPFKIGRNLFRNRKSLYRHGFVTDLLESYLREDDFSSTRIPLLITATNIT